MILRMHLPTILAFGIVSTIGYFALDRVIQRLQKYRFPEEVVKRSEQDVRYGRIIGRLERIFYIYAIMSNFEGILSGWLVLKAFFGWLQRPPDPPVTVTYVQAQNPPMLAPNLTAAIDNDPLIRGYLRLKAIFGQRQPQTQPLPHLPPTNVAPPQPDVTAQDEATSDSVLFGRYYIYIYGNGLSLFFGILLAHLGNILAMFIGALLTAALGVRVQP